MTDHPTPSEHSSTSRRLVWSRIHRIWPYFRPSLAYGWVALVATVLAALTEPLIPALFKPLLDDGFTGGHLPLWSVPLAVIGLFAVRGLAHFVGQYAAARLTNDGMERLRNELFEHMNRAELGLFSRQSASSLSNTIVYEVQNGSQQLISALNTVSKDGFTLLALLGYLFWLNWTLTLLVLTVVPGLSWIMKKLSRRLYRLTRESQQATDDLAYVVEENVLAHRMIRLHGAQAQQVGRFKDLGHRLRQLALKSTVASAAMTPLTQMTAALALSMVLVLALVQSRMPGQSTSVGSFVAFMTAMLMLVSPIRRISDVVNPITRGLAALERGLQLLGDVPPEAQGKLGPERAQGGLRWESVDVCFEAGNQPALSDIQLDIHPGEIVALVGSSGAGKTTLVQTLPRFVLPTRGTVLIDGLDAAQWDLSRLRAQFAMVSQDVVMLNDTVLANVCLGETPHRERAQACLQAAQLWSHIESLPRGMDSLMGHNAQQFSGGQRQRLAIARALYRDAPILILDEATSALDNESEQAVQQALELLMKGRTTLIVAHRLSTIEHADRVVVMARGRIIEQGPPSALLASGGAYARMHQRGEWQDEEQA